MQNIICEVLIGWSCSSDWQARTLCSDVELPSDGLQYCRTNGIPNYLYITSLVIERWFPCSGKAAKCVKLTSMTKLNMAMTGQDLDFWCCTFEAYAVLGRQQKWNMTKNETTCVIFFFFCLPHVKTQREVALHQTTILLCTFKQVFSRRIRVSYSRVMACYPHVTHSDNYLQDDTNVGAPVIVIVIIKHN